MRCMFCQNNESKVAYRLTGYDILLCGNCGLLYNSHYPPKENTYTQNYYCQVQSSAFRFSGEQFMSDPSVPTYARWLEDIERMINKGEVLDVGCGLGTFLAVAKNRKWQGRGVDVSAYAAQQVKEKLDVDVFCGSLLDVAWQRASFDLITFWDSIEHISNPKAYLEKARDLLKPQRLILVSTDNFDCLISDIAKHVYKFSKGKIRYPMERLFIPFNATYFTDRQFCSFVQGLGFEILKCAKVEYPLAKINANRLERPLLATMYFLAKILHRQAQFIILLRKQ